MDLEKMGGAAVVMLEEDARLALIDAARRKLHKPILDTIEPGSVPARRAQVALYDVNSAEGLAAVVGTYLASAGERELAEAVLRAGVRCARPEPVIPPLLPVGESYFDAKQFALDVSRWRPQSGGRRKALSAKGRLLGVSHQTIHRYTRAEVEPRWSDVAYMAAVMRAPINRWLREHYR